MNPRTLRLLELDKVLARLEERTASSLGLGRVRALQPSSQVAEVRSRLAHTSEALQFLNTYHTPPFGGITDIRTALKSASIGSLLDPASLVALAQFAAGSRRLREALLRSEPTEFPLLHNEASVIVPRPEIERAILDAIDEDTREIKDDASLDLLKTRRNMRQTQNNIQSRLRQMLSDPNVQPHLQDAFVTVREGRYCLPVRADSRARVPGIVHDRSGSGGAYFVEPQAVVDMNNHLRELHLQEREAIQAILSDLSARVGAVAGDLKPALEACADLDFIFAKAALSQSMTGIEAPIRNASEPPAYALLQARHPLVKECIPNDILLGDSILKATVQKANPDSADNNEDSGFDVMLITGPNTGGKTVVLKTLGLLTLMTCCGLHIPVAEGSSLSLPGQVFADIGDEQSIEQSLSTFSSHIKNIIHILENSKAGDLVLLDEAGAGTDPDEGAALAKAVLRSLQRRGVQVMATTHYGELKQFALGARRFQNASVEFDVKTLRPTYHLRIGIPGASNALDIAARLGMPVELTNRARRYLGRERAEADEAVQKLEQTQRELTEQTRSAVLERDQIEKLKRDYENKLMKVQREADEKIAAAQSEAHALVRDTRAEADRILRDLRSAARESKQTEEARVRLKTLAEKVEVPKRPGSERHFPPQQSIAPKRGVLKHAPPSHPANQPVLARPSVGDIVRVKTIDKEGVLLSAPDASDRVEIRVGAVKLQVPFAQVEALPRGGKAAGGVSQIKIRKSYTVEDEVNVIGMTTDEALPLVEKYLDDSILAEAKQVRIVHGRGTGTLRNAIHRLLKSHRGVDEYSLAPQNEGGEGATVVTF